MLRILLVHVALLISGALTDPQMTWSVGYDRFRDRKTRKKRRPQGDHLQKLALGFFFVAACYVMCAVLWVVLSSDSVPPDRIVDVPVTTLMAWRAVRPDWPTPSVCMGKYVYICAAQRAGRAAYYDLGI